MHNGEEKLKLLDLIDIDFLQKLQDTFAKAMGVASLTIDEQGPITKQSNSSEFCINFIQACSMGASKCNENDIEGGKIAMEAGEPVIYSCHAGLGHFVVPVIVAKQHIASIIGGQFVFKKPDERHFKNLAKELHIPNEREYVKALRKIKIHSKEHIELAADLLFLISNAISEIAHKNLELKNKNKKEHFYREIIDAIRSSLDINETLYFICEATARFFNVQRTTVSEAPKLNHGSKPFIRMEFKTVADMQGSEKLVNMSEISEYYSSIVESGEILAIDNISEFDVHEFFKENYMELGVKSLLAIPIQKEEKWGILILSEYNNYRHWSDEEIEIAKSIASQIYIAIKHAEIYELEKKTAKRERVLRRLIETIRSSLDINHIKNIMVEEICKTLDANRCFIIEYDKDGDKFLPVTNEYLTSNDFKSAIGFNLNKETKELEKMNREGKEVTLPDLDTFLKENNLYNTPIEKHFKEYEVKSGFSVPISYQNELLGILVIHYTIQKKAFDYEEVELIHALSNQIAIAIHQAKLYEKEKATTAKEIALRDTIKIIRSSLNSKKIRNDFLAIACNYFQADRCIFTDYDREEGKFLPFEIELIREKGVKSLINVDAEELFPEFIEKIKSKKRNIIIKDIEKTLSRKLLPEYKSIQSLRQSDAKSDYGLIVQYQNDLMGTLVLHYVKEKRILTHEELDFLNILRDQAGIALYQAELYEKSLKQIKREILFRKIIEEIRSSFDIFEVKQKVITYIAEVLNANRCYIAEFDEKTNKYIPIYQEYLASPDLKSIINYDVEKNIPELVEHVKKNPIISIPNVDEFIRKNKFSESISNYFKDFNIKSRIYMKISYMEHFFGTLIVNFPDPVRRFLKEDINFITTLANQIGTVLYQASLFEKEKQTILREKLISDVTSQALKTFDLTQIKSILTTVGKMMDADRCFFVELEPSLYKVKPPTDYDAEYLSSPEIKSIVGHEFSAEEGAKFFQMYLEKRDIVVFDYVELSRLTSPEFSEVVKYIEKFDLKSSVGIPIFYEDKFVAILAIEYVRKKMIPTEDELNFLRVLANQIGMVTNQIKLYKDTKMKAEREILLRNIIEKIRSSLDVEETLSFICEETAKLFNVQRTSISEFPDLEDYKKHITRMEYKAAPAMRGLVDLKDLDNLTKFYIEYLLKHTEILAIDNIQESNTPDYFKESYTILGVKSIMVIPIQNGDYRFGVLILSEYNNYKYWTNDEIRLAESVASQIHIAIKQAKLFEKSQNQVKRESLLREITEKIRSSLNIEETLSFICEEAAKIFNVQRTAITSFPNSDNYETFVIRKEYKYWQDMEGFGTKSYSSRTAAYWAKFLIDGGEVLAIDNIENSNTPDYFKATYNEMGVKAIIGTAIRRGDDVWGTLVLAEYNNDRNWSEDDKVLLKTIADQIYIAINQAELYEKAQKKAQNEKTLREIMLMSVQNFDLKDIITSIVIETGKLLKADRCFFIAIDLDTDTNIPIREYAEYLSSDDIESHMNYPPSKEESGIFIEDVKNSRIRFSGDAMNEDLPEATKKMFETLAVKSYLHLPVVYGEMCYGALIIHYVHDFKTVSQDEIAMATAIANQSAIVIYKAELYETIKIQAEREKISKNIIEILRSTLDKGIIKRLFVKNIGQFLNADRVLFSEFNQETKMYNPASADSEYLSEPDIKSFVGYDWSCDEAQEYIQPILERRELHIYNWNEYIQGNYRGQDFINLFESMNIKSSYSFPVMYQQKIMGFFSIGFVKKVRRLSDEDINRIRSICTQAGIALYHAHLYEDAQKSVQEHDKFVNKLSSELNEPLSLIADFSSIKSRHELECAEEIEHLNTINENAKKLIYFISDITKSMKKLNLE